MNDSWADDLVADIDRTNGIRLERSILRDLAYHQKEIEKYDPMHGTQIELWMIHLNLIRECTRKLKEIK